MDVVNHRITHHITITILQYHQGGGHPFSLLLVITLNLYHYQHHFPISCCVDAINRVTITFPCKCMLLLTALYLYPDWLQFSVTNLSADGFLVTWPAKYCCTLMYSSCTHAHSYTEQTGQTGFNPLSECLTYNCLSLGYSSLVVASHVEIHTTINQFKVKVVTFYDFNFDSITSKILQKR